MIKPSEKIPLKIEVLTSKTDNFYEQNENLKNTSKKLKKLKRINSIKENDTDEAKNALLPLNVQNRDSNASLGNNLLTNGALIKSKDVCLMEESPYYIHRIAQTDRLDEFKRLYYEEPSRLKLRDNIKDWLPIHYAAFKSKIKIIDFILEKSEQNMINSKDMFDNTPLHIAISRGFKDCCLFLLNRGADTAAQNKAQHAAIHQCIVSNQPTILESLLTHNSKPNIHLGGENGGTALHYCAYSNNYECAQILVKNGSNLCRPCNNGYFPIHLAAQRSSNQVLEFLISEGTKKGCSRLNMLSFVDGDNNKPLHAAVQFGNLGTVQLCLEHGASIDEKIELDGSTPVHVACSQGSLEILKLMHEKQPDLFLEIVHTVDAMEMTPLHKAAMFDHVDVATYLLEKGAYIDALDKEKRSPMLLAASRNCIKIVCYLLCQGANIKLKDSKMRNLLHLILSPETNGAVADGADVEHSNSLKINVVKALEKISEKLKIKENYIDLLNEQDVDGCTAIHYASKLGYVNCLKMLVGHGGDITAKNNDKQSPLHFAARYGRYNSCLQILNSQNYKNYINEKDSHGQTPLLLAAQTGHNRVVQLLMQKGALIFKSFNGNSPFHEAAANGYCNCLKTIYSIDPHVLNSVNKEGNTPLHLACKEGHARVIEFLLDIGAKFTCNSEGLTFIDLAIKFKQHQALMTIISHDRWEEALDLSSKEFKTPLIGIIQLSSEVTQAVLERCVTKNNDSPENGEKIPYIRFNFKYLNWCEEKVGANGKIKYYPMLPLMMMVKYGRIDCLSHQLCEKLLQRKWSLYGLPIYGITTLLYIMFLSALTLIVVTHPSCIHGGEYEYRFNDTCYSLQHLDNSYYLMFKRHYGYQILSFLCIMFSFLYILKESAQISIEKLEYFKNFQVYIQLILYPLTVLFVSPFLFSSITFHFQWQIGSIVIFTAWLNLLLYMQRFYIFGIYVVMFIEILKTLFKVIFLFSILIIGFALVFFILLGNEDFKEKNSPLISILRTIIMMLGETDGLNSFIYPYINGRMHFGVMSLLFLILFVFLMPILLTNLLIGLAVGDIESIQRDAKLKREAMQVQLHVDLERKMPKKLFEKVNEKEYRVEYSTLCKLQSPTEILESKETDSSQTLFLELLNQKQRLNTVKSAIDNQTELIKLIIQKMEIKTELGEYDASMNKTSAMRRLNMIKKNSRSSSLALRSIALKHLMSADHEDSIEN